MSRSLIFWSMAILCFASVSVLGCTTFMATDGNTVFMGDSEDAGPHHPLAGNPAAAFAFFLPGSEEAYGRIHLGWLWQGEHRSFQAGMNEMGLAYGLTSVPSVPMNPHPEKTYQRSDGNLFDRLLRLAADVNEAIDFLQQTGFGDLAFQIQIADADGRSAVAGPGLDGELAIVRKDEDAAYQIATTFNLAHPGEAIGRDSTVRFDSGRALLASGLAASADPLALAQAALTAVHREGAYALGGTYTVYASLYDLTSLTVTHYPLARFEDPIVFNLVEELSKGERAVALQDLMSGESLAEATRTYKMRQIAGIGVAAASVLVVLAMAASVLGALF